MNIKRYLHFKRSKEPAFSSEHVSWLERLGEDAYTGWAIISLLSFIVAITLVSMAAQLFLRVNSGDITAPEVAAVPASHATIDQKSLDGVIASFDAKASETSVLKKGYAGPPDPSQ